VAKASDFLIKGTGTDLRGDEVKVVEITPTIKKNK